MANRHRNSPWPYAVLSAVTLASILYHFRSVEQMFPQRFGIVQTE